MTILKQLKKLICLTTGHRWKLIRSGKVVRLHSKIGNIDVIVASRDHYWKCLSCELYEFTEGFVPVLPNKK